jgi:hypothetical protein
MTMNSNVIIRTRRYSIQIVIWRQKVNHVQVSQPMTTTPIIEVRDLKQEIAWRQKFENQPLEDYKWY